VEIRTDAGPSNAVQCVFIGGLYTTASQVRQCQEVPPAVTEAGLMLLNYESWCRAIAAEYRMMRLSFQIAGGIA
jgi:hypothetical protein